MLVTLLLVGLPLLDLLLLGKRGEDLLPKVRDWMTNNSWVISEIVLVFFLALTISSLFSWRETAGRADEGWLAEGGQEQIRGDLFGRAEQDQQSGSLPSGSA